MNTPAPRFLLPLWQSSQDCMSWSYSLPGWLMVISLVSPKVMLWLQFVVSPLPTETALFSALTLCVLDLSSATGHSVALALGHWGCPWAHSVVPQVRFSQWLMGRPPARVQNHICFMTSDIVNCLFLNLPTPPSRGSSASILRVLWEGKVFLH